MTDPRTALDAIGQLPDAEIDIADAALQLARAGARTLLVDRKPFPRAKVCGGCVNARAVAILERAGLGDSMRAAGARPVSAIQLRANNHQAGLPLPPSLAITRAALDAIIVRAAIAAGADGLIVEVHPCPREAMSDGQQSLSPEQFAELMSTLGNVAQAVGRRL